MDAPMAHWTTISWPSSREKLHGLLAQRKRESRSHRTQRNVSRLGVRSAETIDRTPGKGATTSLDFKRRRLADRRTGGRASRSSFCGQRFNAHVTRDRAAERLGGLLLASYIAYICDSGPANHGHGGEMLRFTTRP